MEWNEAGISSAIQTAKATKALFVVVVLGTEDDEDTKCVIDLLNGVNISEKLKPPFAISIKVFKDTVPYRQFTALYPVILVPSIYFIDSCSGLNLEVAVGHGLNEEALLKSLDKAISVREEKVLMQNTSPDVVPADVASPRGVRVQEARRVLQEASGVAPNQATKSEDLKSKESATGGSLSMEERVARAKQLLADKRTNSALEAAEKEKNAELTRRNLGKEMQNFKKKQEEQEAWKAAEELRRNKEEEHIARERVRAQIAQDRAEKAARFNHLKAETEKEKMEEKQRRLEQEKIEAAKFAANRSTQARIQFRCPDGSSLTNSFEADAPLSSVYTFVQNQMKSNPLGGGFSLSMMFPRRLLDDEPDKTPLRELGLVPSGTVLILARRDTGSSLSRIASGGIVDHVWLLLTPLTILWSFLASFFVGSSSSLVSSTRNGPSQVSGSSSSFIQSGNITRLRNADDDNDENNTDNGNSTQQM